MITGISRNLVGLAGAALFTALVVGAAAGPAQAQPSMVGDSVSARVSYADLNLTDPGARTTLDRRIKAAARTVCAVDSRELKRRMTEVRCIKDAIANAVRS